MSRIAIVSLLTAVLCVPTALCAQQSSNEPTGAVTGTVFDQDTQRPVRFAQVQLQRVSDVTNPGEQGNGGERNRFRGGQTSTRTGPEGTFFLGGVSPGDYYAFASGPGFIPERTLLQQAIAGGADPAALLGQIPVVHVAVESTANVSLNLVHGGVIGGRVQWDDGAAASGISVSVVPTTQETALPPTLQRVESPSSNAFNNADDRGSFRLSGLGAGSYYVQVIIQPPNGAGSERGNFLRQQFASPIRVFAPGVYRKADAAVIVIKAGEERTDVQITLDLRALHAVSGVASSASAGTPVAYGRVSLTDSTDSSLVISGAILPDGSFSVHYVPAGSYTLQISGASSQVPSFNRRPEGGGVATTPAGTRFANFAESITVPATDLTGVNVSLTPQ